MLDPGREDVEKCRSGIAGMKNRRRDIRIAEENKVILTVRVSRDAKRGRPVFPSFSRDISAGGVRILTGARLEPGERVDLEITLSGSRRMIRTAAEVRWVREVYEGQVFEAGLVFIGMDPEAEIALIDHVYGRSRRRPGPRPRPGRDREGGEP